MMIGTKKKYDEKNKKDKKRMRCLGKKSMLMNVNKTYMIVIDES
jgi:hypothetical protein